MPIDLAALDAKIKKLQMIRKLASDPDVVDLLSDIVTSNGNGGASRKPQIPVAERKGVRYDVLKHVPSSDPSDPSDSGVPLTAKEIAEKMEEFKYKFKSQDHPTTVRESLRELEKERLIEKAGVNEDGAAMWRRTE